MSSGVGYSLQMFSVMFKLSTYVSIERPVRKGRKEGWKEGRMERRKDGKKEGWKEKKMEQERNNKKEKKGEKKKKKSSKKLIFLSLSWTKGWFVGSSLSAPTYT